MEFTPRYPQPFGLKEATALDVGTITEEIARLENSLHHLRETQRMLQECIEESGPEDADIEVTKALRENEVVIGSQQERITILKLALLDKGVIGGSHYDATPISPPMTEASQEGLSTSIEQGPVEEDETTGVFL